MQKIFGIQTPGKHEQNGSIEKQQVMSIQVNYITELST